MTRKIVVVETWVTREVMQGMEKHDCKDHFVETSRESKDGEILVKILFLCLPFFTHIFIQFPPTDILE